MTTVVYSNGILAADSRTTALQGSKKIHCTICKSTEGVCYSDDACKLHGNFGTHSYRGEKILAVAQAGERSLSTAMVHSIKKNHDPFEAYELFLWHKPKGMTDHRSSGLLIVTSKSVFKLTITKEMRAAEKFTRDDDVVFGSGSAAASLYLKMVKRDAVEAVAAASLTDESTGGIIHSYDISELGENYTKPHPNKINLDSFLKDLKARMNPVS